MSSTSNMEPMDDSEEGYVFDSDKPAKPVVTGTIPLPASPSGDQEPDDLLTFQGLGKLRYRCPAYPDCKWNSNKKTLVLKHWMEEHAVREQSIGPTLYDASEKPIAKENIMLPKALQNL